MKKIPYGILNYKELREEEYLYVDKTMYLEKLETLDDNIILFKDLELLEKVCLQACCIITTM